MQLPILLAAAAAASSVPLLVWSVAGARAPSSPARARRNLFRGTAAVPVDLRELRLSSSAADRALRPTLRWLADRGRRLTPAGWVRSLDRRVALAGRPATWTLERVLAAKVVLVVVGLAAAVAAFGLGGAWRLAALLVPAVAYLVPDLALQHLGQRREEEIQRDLPDVLDQLSIAVEAGLGFEAAMAHVGRQSTGPLSDELIRTLQEIQVGVVRNRALRNLAGRSRNTDLQHFITAVIQAESYGIPIADVLRTQSREMRIKRRQYAEERAQKIPVKLVFPLVLCILPALFVVIIGPGAIRISQTLLAN